jgi:hypothetical protein
MTELKRYDICHDSFDINVSLIEKTNVYGNYVKASEHEDAIAERDARIAELENALRDAAVQTSVHFDRRYVMNGFLYKDEHGELCYFNDILNHLERYTKIALEAKDET